jgi:hypothetical protein
MNELLASIVDAHGGSIAGEGSTAPTEPDGMLYSDHKVRATRVSSKDRHVVPPVPASL